MTKERSSLKKKNLLQKYISRTHNEINLSASKTLKPIYKDTDVLSIDDGIQPILIVLANDILNGEHQKAVDTAASYKISALAMKSIQCGEVGVGIPDIGALLPVLQGLMSSIPLITSAAGSFMECIGKNINVQCDERVFPYGLAMNIGANLSNTSHASTLQSIGICIGNILHDINKEDNYKNFAFLVKTLPPNRFRKRLSEYVKSIYDEPISDSSNQHTPSQNKTNHIKANQITSKTTEERSSLKEEEMNAIKIGVIGTRENLNKAIEEIKNDPLLNEIKFSVEDDSAIAEKVKVQKKKVKEVKIETNDEIKFNVIDK